jgi:plastocyanin
MKKTSIFVKFIFLLILLSPAFLWFTKNKGPVTVNLTEEGFTPVGIKIPKGSEVTFINRTSKSFWPASDLHPSHGIYPDFDPKKEMPPGSKWSYKFDEPGTYRYHDHITPSNRGIIIVTEAEVPRLGFKINVTKDDFRECKESSGIDEKRICYTHLLEDMILQKGPDTTFNLINELRGEDPAFAADCHTVAHSLGEVSYWNYAKNSKLPQTGAIGYCGFGYLHGFMQEVGHHSKNFVDEAGSLCKHFTAIDYTKHETTVDPGDQCFHGAGHGMAFFYISDFNEDLPGLIKKGQRDCGRISNDPIEVSNCVYGLFGGISSTVIGGHGYKINLDEKDPLNFCRLMDDDLKEPCFDSMVPTMGVLFNNDFEKIAGTFSGVPDKFLKQPFFAIGDLASKWVSLGVSKESEIVKTCNARNSVLKKECFLGYTQGLIRNGPGAGIYPDARQICISNLSSADSEDCIRALDEEKARIYPND